MKKIIIGIIALLFSVGLSAQIFNQDVKIVKSNPRLYLNTTYIGVSGNQITINGSPINANSVWGNITGTLSNQTDLYNALNLRAPKASPTFTGTVILPATTSIGSVSSTELGYVNGVTSNIQTQLTSKAPKASPTFTGTVVLPSTTSIGSVDNTEISYLNGVTSAIQTQLNTKADTAGAIDPDDYYVKLLPDTVAHTSSFTLALTDANKWLPCTKATSLIITIPAAVTVDFPIGTTMNFTQTGAGILVFKAAAGVTIESYQDSVATGGRNAWVGLYKRATNKWQLYGNIGD